MRAGGPRKAGAQRRTPPRTGRDQGGSPTWSVERLLVVAPFAKR